MRDEIPVVQMCGVLFVDNEAVALKYFERAFAEQFPVYSVSSGAAALKLLDKMGDKIGVIVTDQRMPDLTGVQLLEEVRKRHPMAVRILTTAYSDMEVLVAAINSGSVYSFVPKPWDLDEMEKVLTRAVEWSEAQSRDATLIATKMEELRLKILEDRVYDVGRVSAKIGHYVHNALCPLTFVIEQLIDHGGGAPSLPIDYLKGIRDHLFEVSQTLKDLDQVTQPMVYDHLETLDLGKISDRALEETAIIRAQKGLTVERTIREGTPTIRGDAGQMTKLFRFMLAEEIVSLPDGSQVRMEIGPCVADGEVLGVNVEFADDVAVPEHTGPETLLHPFNLRGSNPREFGVFLVSCYFIVRNQGGTLKAWINEKKGLSISLFLPLEPDTLEIEDLLPEKLNRP